MHAMPRRRALLVVLIALGGARALQAQQFLGSHPNAATQSTVLGKTLHTLEVADDKVYIGYGDYNANTGPIRMRYYDPATSGYSGVLTTGNTEAFSRLRVIGSKVFGLHTDPRGSSLGGYAHGQANGTGWSDYSALPMVHVYDIHEFQGSLFLSGSGGPSSPEHSVIYRSTDGGANWSVSLNTASPLDGYDYSFARYYGLGQIGGKLYTQQNIAYYNDVNGTLVFQGNGFPKLMAFDGTQWNEDVLMRTPQGGASRMLDPDFHAGQLVFRNSHSGYGAGAMFYFNGTDMTQLTLLKDDLTPALFHDHFVDASGLYVLRNDGKVSFSQGYNTWHTLLEGLPSTFRSIARLGDYLYFGDNNAGLYRMAFTAVPEPGLMVLAAGAGMFLVAGTRRRRQAC